MKYFFSFFFAISCFGYTKPNTNCVKTLNTTASNNSFFKQLEFNKIKIIEDLSEKEGYSGQGHQGLFWGLINNRHVFIKFPSRNVDESILRTDLLSRSGLGPKLIGTTKDQAGNIGIVTAFVDGIHANRYTLASNIPENFRLHEWTVDKIREHGQILRHLGFVHIPDLQYRIAEDGTPYIVDPEYFSFNIPVQYLSLPEEYRPIQSPEKESELMARNWSFLVNKKKDSGGP